MSFKSKFNAYYLLTLICVIYIFDYADRHVMSSLLPFIKEDWHVQDVDLGLLTSIVSLFVGIFSIPLSILIDRWSRKKMVAIMVIFWSMATLMCAFVENYTQLLIFRALTGLGEAAYAAAAVALITKNFPRQHRSIHIGIYNAAAPLGAGLGMAVGGYIGMMYGWRHAFGLVALPGLLLGIMFLFTKDYHTVPLEGESNSFFSKLRLTFKSIIDLLKIKTLWFVYLAYALNIGVNTSILSWSPSYFVRFLGFDPEKAGKISGLIAALVILGAPLGGFLADKWSKRYKNSKLVVSWISTLLSGIVLFLAFYTTNETLSMVSLFLFGILTVVYLAPATSVIQDVVPPGVRAVSFGFNVMFMNLIGAFLTPILVGKISDIVDLRYALMLLPVLSVIATILLIAVKKQYFRDMK